MKKRIATVERNTKETQIRMELNIDGRGETTRISTGIPFFDHMLSLFTVHGFFDLAVEAKGDLEIDSHHTVEDLGLVLGDAIQKALGDRKKIRRYGHAVTPMDEALGTVTIDLSNRPFLVFNVPPSLVQSGNSLTCLAKEFFRAVSTRGGISLHINVAYGENEHHIIESVFKSLGRALNEASSLDPRISDVRSSKGTL
jgi:imidazoleglycerol-phosphate dehydratase